MDDGCPHNQSSCRWFSGGQRVPMWGLLDFAKRGTDSGPLRPVSCHQE